MLTQLRILCCHTHRTGVGVTLSHHHTTQDYQRQCAERELVSTQHSHDYHVLGGLQLSVGLQAHIMAQAVHHECLLGFGKSYLRRDTCKTHTAGRTGTCATLCTADYYEVSLCLCHTSGDGSHSTLSNQFHTDSSSRVDVLQVEDKLCQILDAVNIVVWWWRNERNAWYGVTRLGYYLVHLESRQLSALARLGTLSHLYLQFLSIHQVFCCHAKASAGYLFGLTAQTHAVHLSVVAGVILTTLTSVAASA